MKSITSIVILFTFIFTGIPSGFAASSEDCKGMNHPAYQAEYRACLRTKIAASATDAGVDCVDCIFNQEKADSSSGWVEALSAIAQPLAFLAGTYTMAKFESENQKKWAAAYASGFEQCTNRFNSYLNYATTSGANTILPAEAQSFATSCNGNSYGSYAGFGGMMGNGFGGYGNPFLQSGYSQGFMSGSGGFSGGFNFGAGVGAGVGSVYDTGMTAGSMGVGAAGSSTGSSVYQTGVTTGFSF